MFFSGHNTVPTNKKLNNLGVCLMHTQTIRTLLILLLATALWACEEEKEEDDSSNPEYGHVQFYNGSFNSPETFLYIDDKKRSSASFGSISNRHRFKKGKYNLELKYNNADNKVTSINEQKLNIKKNGTTLFIANNDFSDLTVSEVNLPQADKKDKFNLGFFNITAKNTIYDVYLAKDSGAFSSAKLINSFNYLTKPNLKSYDDGDYTFYLTKGGSTDVIFKSSKVTLKDKSNFVIVIRQSYTIKESTINLDIINATSKITNLKHNDAQGQLRLINTIDDYSKTVFSAKKGDKNNTTKLTNKDTYSDYLTLTPNSYSVGMQDADKKIIGDNFLVTIEPEASNVGLFYKHKKSGVRMLTVKENHTPSSYSHIITVANLLDTYNEEDMPKVDVIFTLSGETVENAKHKIEDIAKYTQKSIAVVNNTYTAYVLFEDNKQQIVLMQQVDMDLSKKGNYILILEHDTTTSSGYKMTLERTLNESAK